jgi:hypothetical protein
MDPLIVVLFVVCIAPVLIPIILLSMALWGFVLAGIVHIVTKRLGIRLPVKRS